MIRSNRQTGRTTRLLREAIRASDVHGVAVYVVAANAREVTRIKRQLAVMHPGWEDQLGIKVETPAMLGNLDWDTVTLRGAFPTVRVLIDHLAIEDRYARILAEYHRYDAAPQDDIDALCYGKFETPGDTIQAGHDALMAAKRRAMASVAIHKKEEFHRLHTRWSEPQDPETWSRPDDPEDSK